MPCEYLNNEFTENGEDYLLCDTFLTPTTLQRCEKCSWYSEGIGMNYDSRIGKGGIKYVR